MKQIFRIFSIVAALAFLASLTGTAFALTPSNGQAATLVLGQPDFTSNANNTTQTGMYYPEGVAVDPTTHKVFVVDTYNNRVLRFASVYTLGNGSAAEAVLGQPNFTNYTGAATQSGMDAPIGVFVDAGGRLWVADARNNRVLRFDHASAIASGANANAVLGQPNFTSVTPHTSQNGMAGPSGVFVDAGGRLWVAEIENNRVLRFNSAASKPNGANADGVLGQPNFTSSTGHTTQNGMSGANSIFLDTSGHLWVARFIQ